MVGDQVVLVNRTSSRVLEFTADGRHYALKPGDNYGFLEGHVRFARSQNPLMGSEDYHTLNFDSLVGVKGRTNCEPISDEDLELSELNVERFDPQSLPRQNRVAIKPRHPRMKGRIDGGAGANANAFAVGE